MVITGSLSLIQRVKQLEQVNPSHHSNLNSINSPSAQTSSVSSTVPQSSDAIPQPSVVNTASLSDPAQAKPIVLPIHSDHKIEGDPVSSDSPDSPSKSEADERPGSIAECGLYEHLYQGYTRSKAQIECDMYGQLCSPLSLSLSLLHPLFCLICLNICGKL